MTPNTRVKKSLRKKYKKAGYENCGDRISNLHDSALSHILSLLPTKDAVRTSVLSKDWEYKWTSIYSVGIHDRDQLSKKKKILTTSFIKFVDRVLFLTGDAKQFHLYCEKNHGVSRMTNWIVSALTHNLRSLSIVYGKRGIILPPQLFSCCSLEELVLKLPCTLKVPQRIYLGSLTTLRLEEVSILNEASNANPVMFDLPVVVEFTLRNCKWLNVNCVEIHAPTMKSFECRSLDVAVLNDYSIKIIGGSIQKFQSYGDVREHIVVSGGSSVVSATLENTCGELDFHLYGNSGLHVRELLREFSNLEYLKLSDVGAQAITLSKLVGLSLPRFHNLEELVFYGNLEALHELLHATPSLKRLTLNLRNFPGYNYNTETCVPSCLKSHLEEVSILRFRGRRSLWDMVKYLLENGLKLKKLDLAHTIVISDADEVAKEISMCSKASTCVTVSISDRNFIELFSINAWNPSDEV